MGTDRRRDVTASGESEDADTLWINVPFSRPGSYSADRARRILQRRRMMITRSEPILEHERRNAQVVKPFRDRSPLVIGQVSVASTRTNDDRCTSRLFFRREIRRQRRDVVWFFANGARCAIGPKDDCLFGGNV